MYPEVIMQNRLEEATSEELTDMLVTLDGRSKKWKQKALDILLARKYLMGLQDGFKACKESIPIIELPKQG